MTKKLYFIITIVVFLFLGGCGIIYEWKGFVDMPVGLSKENQQKIAQCILTKYNTPEFKSQLYSQFISTPKQQIEALSLAITDGSKVYDFHTQVICITITIPSTKESYRESNPMLEYLKLKIKDEISVCEKSISVQ